MGLMDEYSAVRRLLAVCLSVCLEVVMEAIRDETRDRSLAFQTDRFFDGDSMDELRNLLAESG